MRQRVLCWMLAAAVVASCTAGDVELHVNAAFAALKHDSYRGHGTEAKPFVSLEEAKEHIISLRQRTGKEGEHNRTVVIIHPGIYSPLAIDHPALSATSWKGAPGAEIPVVSGGIQVPPDRFKRHSDTIFVAHLGGIGADDLGAMISGDCVGDCQHDKVGVTIGGEAMTLARWPNAPVNTTAPGGWAHAASCSDDGFIMNFSATPEARRLLKWADEPDAYLHGYWQWDWADCYGGVLAVQNESDDSIRIRYGGAAPGCKDGARWYGVNMLCELDAPGEFYIDAVQRLLYVIPPNGVALDAAHPVMLTYQPGGVLNITAAARNVHVSRIDVRDGRHAGVLAVGTHGTRLEALVVHAHGTVGIDLSSAPQATITGSHVFDVGCTGIKATAGDAASLQPGGLLIEDNVVHHFAKWKRSYHPGIFWGGVGNTFRGNHVSFGPHNGFLGGGDFADGVENLFEQNHVSDCTFDTIDSGGFYTCGQRGTAFTNRGNVLRNNTFERIFNTAGLGVQVASNQAVYLDDQMSAWSVENNTFIDCQIGVFNGGGRRNLFRNNLCAAALYSI